MKYLILIHNTDDGNAVLESTLAPEFRAAHDSVMKELRASGELVDSDELDVEEAWTITADERGRTAVTDGPYTEGREITGGYYLIDCATPGRARDIAGRFVEARFAPVEVRRLVHSNSTITA